MKEGNALIPIILTSASETPDEYRISNAYPNPFNPTVNFDI